MFYWLFLKEKNTAQRKRKGEEGKRKAEKDLCKQIGPKLVTDGLYFVGIDVIGGKLVEVNVMSPGGITYINKVYKPKVKVEERVIDFVEGKVLEKLQQFDRRVRLRKTVEDA